MTVHSVTSADEKSAITEQPSERLAAGSTGSKAELGASKADRAETERAVKRERILDAAQTIFAAHGFFAARVQQIAHEAGVADGTIYLYFKSKDDLLISLFESRMERVNRTLSEAITGRPPIVQLRQFVSTYLMMVNAEPAAAAVLTIELRQSSKFMNEYDNPRFAEFLRILSGVIASGQQQGDFANAVPAPMAARMIFGMLDELVTSWVLSLEKTESKISGKRDKSSHTRPNTHGGKKFDIVRAADWVVALVENGLTRSR
jgi:TetR/AcrR family transcriptional regulator, fatty acid metabolism regulator protein